MPISLAASSQMQIGSAPASNFCQRLSQSIIGTKQLNVEGTDSGPPFFIHTRNRAGCSPSISTGGSRSAHFVRSLGSGPPFYFCCQRLTIGGGLVAEGRNWDSKCLAKIALYLANSISVHRVIQLPNMRNVMHTCGRPPSGSGTAGGNVADRNYPLCLHRGYLKHLTGKPQPIDSIQPLFLANAWKQRCIED